jgi:hypothetical protein
MQSMHNKLTTSDWSPAITRMNCQMYFHRVLGSMAPPDPPTGFLWVRSHEEEGPHDVIGRPVLRDHLPLRLEVPELRHDDFGCAKKLAEAFLRQQRPDSSAALIMDVLANEEKILWRRLRSMPAFVAVHIGHG